MSMSPLHVVQINTILHTKTWRNNRIALYVFPSTAPQKHFEVTRSESPRHRSSNSEPARGCSDALRSFPRDAHAASSCFSSVLSSIVLR